MIMKSRKSILKIPVAFLLFCSLISFTACSQDDDANPNEEPKWKTTPIATAIIEIEGEDKIEFKSFSEKQYNETWQNMELPAYTEDGGLLLQFYSKIDNENEPIGGITILITNYKGKGDYSIEGDKLNEDSVAIFRRAEVSENYLNVFTSGKFELDNDDTAEGSGNVKVREVKNGRISGDFELVTHNMEGTTAHITNGKFDVKLLSN